MFASCPGFLRGLNFREKELNVLYRIEDQVSNLMLIELVFSVPKERVT